MSSSGAAAAGNNGGTSIIRSIAERWRELHGENSWNGLLEPLDLDLRKSLISYGELVCATGCGFNGEKRSPHYGLCMYGHDDLLAKSGVSDASRHYGVTKFVYATEAEEKKPTWIGYVAAATDAGVAALGRRDIVVAWRGTLTDDEKNKDLEFAPASAEAVLGKFTASRYPSAKVHRGFLSVYAPKNDDGSEVGKASAKCQVREEVSRLVELYKDEEISITVVGHSLGASLAVLNAVDLVGHGVNKASCPVTAFVFACPHVGNHAFRDAMESFEDLRVLHMKNKIDPVPQLMRWLPDLGVTLHIDTTLSPYIKEPKIKTAHELECYLHAIAGEVGGEDGNKSFDLVVDRDVALLNRNNDVLTDDHPVPPSWWVVEHKSMVKNGKGKWELKDFEAY